MIGGRFTPRGAFETLYVATSAETARIELSPGLRPQAWLAARPRRCGAQAKGIARYGNPAMPSGLGFDHRQQYVSETELALAPRYVDAEAICAIAIRGLVLDSN